MSGVIHAWIKFLGTVVFGWMEFHIYQDGWQLYKAQDYDSVCLCLGFDKNAWVKVVRKIVTSATCYKSHRQNHCLSLTRPVIESNAVWSVEAEIENLIWSRYISFCTYLLLQISSKNKCRLCETDWRSGTFYSSQINLPLLTDDKPYRHNVVF